MRAKDKKPINLEIGGNIKFYREQSGYTRERLAELVGRSPRFIADVESGFVGVSLSTLKRICLVLGISADRILWGGPASPPGLDERVCRLEEKYARVIVELVQKQLELIAALEEEKQQRDGQPML